MLKYFAVLLIASGLWGQAIMRRSIPPAAGGGSVTLDVVGSGVASCCTGSTSVSTNHTITNGLTNTAVVVILSWQLTDPTVNGCTHNGNAMTQMWNFQESAVNYSGSAGFIIATGTGDGTSKTVTCTFTSTVSESYALTTISFGGVNQSTPARSAFTGTVLGTTSTSVSVSVTNSTSGDIVVDGCSSYNAGALTSTTTLRQNFNAVAGNNMYHYVSTAAPSGSQTMGYTFASSTPYIACGAAAIRP